MADSFLHYDDETLFLQWIFSTGFLSNNALQTIHTPKCIELILQSSKRTRKLAFLLAKPLTNTCNTSKILITFGSLLEKQEFMIKLPCKVKDNNTFNPTVYLFQLA